MSGTKFLTIGNEIPSLIVAASFVYIKNIAAQIPEIDNDSEIELLIGRDLISAHHVLEHRVAPRELPYAQSLPLGWVIIGNVCLGKFHEQDIVNVNKSVILRGGRTTSLDPCENEISIHLDPAFKKSHMDEKQGLSVEDGIFLDIMASGYQKLDNGQWIDPLPFKPNRPAFPYNKNLAERRSKSFDRNLQNNVGKHKHGMDFMQKLFENGHTEDAPQLPPDKQCWYLPMFSVYHPRKPESVRVVFDSSAKHQGFSLNDVLLKGPDIYNSLLGILMRFRKEAYAETVDTEQMFHNFKVLDEHRRY